MVYISKVYTRKGDDGKTSLLGNRIPKNALKIEALGLLDELNCFLGWLILVMIEDYFNFLKQRLSLIQQELFDMGAYLCNRYRATSFTDSVALLEQEMDLMNLHLEPLTSFVLPGGSEVSARLHIARTVCRRVERTLAGLSEEEIGVVIPYLNRLSDWLFVAARYTLRKQSIKEELWQNVQG